MSFAGWKIVARFRGFPFARVQFRIWRKILPRPEHGLPAKTDKQLRSTGFVSRRKVDHSWRKKKTSGAIAELWDDCRKINHGAISHVQKKGSNSGLPRREHNKEACCTTIGWIVLRYHQETSSPGEREKNNRM